MLRFAPRISPLVHAEIERLSRRSLPIAEINRRVGRAAWRRRLPKPSYERVRVLVHVARSRARLRLRIVPHLETKVEIGVGLTLWLGRRHNDSAPLPRASPLC